MAQQDPSAIAAKWAQNLGSATQRITDGINSVTVAPGQAAARQKGAWVANTTASADKWAANSAAVPLSQWQQDTINKGVPRIASGASAAQPKFTTFMGQLLPFINTARSSLPARGNLEANIARMTAFTRKMATFKATKGAGS